MGGLGLLFYEQPIYKFMCLNLLLILKLIGYKIICMKDDFLFSWSFLKVMGFIEYELSKICTYECCETTKFNCSQNIGNIAESYRSVPAYFSISLF